MGAVTGKGLTDLIREQFGMRWSAFATLACSSPTPARRSPSSSASARRRSCSASRAGSPCRRWPVLLWWLVTHGSYKAVERIFLLIAALLRLSDLRLPRPSPLGRRRPGRLVVPDLFQPARGYMIDAGRADRHDDHAVYAAVRASQRGRERRHTRRLQAGAGRRVRRRALRQHCRLSSSSSPRRRRCSCTPRISQHGGRRGAGAGAASPGSGASSCSRVGLFGASMLAAAVLPLTTAYSLSREAVRLRERGVSFSFREAPFFMGIFTVLIALGALSR